MTNFNQIKQLFEASKRISFSFDKDIVAGRIQTCGAPFWSLQYYLHTSKTCLSTCTCIGYSRVLTSDGNHTVIFDLKATCQCHEISDTDLNLLKSCCCIFAAYEGELILPQCS